MKKLIIDGDYLFYCEEVNNGRYLREEDMIAYKGKNGHVTWYNNPSNIEFTKQDVLTLKEWLGAIALNDKHVCGNCRKEIACLKPELERTCPRWEK